MKNIAENINNIVTIIGEIISDFRYSHQVYGERFYLIDVKVTRTSGYEDVIPVMISERLIDAQQSYTGQCIRVKGQFRSYNRHEENGNHLVLSVFVQEYELMDGLLTVENSNHIELCGYICKQPIYRKTPLGREISDILLAVNRTYGKSDYIPCICWGRNAVFASSLGTGSYVKISGRIQSRNYQKKIFDGNLETRTAYEVSVNTVEVIADEG